MSDLAQYILKAYVRKALFGLACVLITHNAMATGDTADSFVVKYVEPVTAAVLAGVSALWEYGYQEYVKRKVKKALALEQGSTSRELARALGELPEKAEKAKG